MFTLLASPSFASGLLAQGKPADEKLAEKLYQMFTNIEGRSLEQEKVVDVTNGNVLSGKLWDRGRFLATFDDQGNLALWDLDQDKQLSTRKPTGEPKTGVVAVDRQQLIAFGGPDGKVEIYDGNKQDPPLNTYTELKAPVAEIGFTDQGRFYAFDESGAAIIGKARKQEVLLLPPEFGPNDKPRTVMGVGGEKCWWRISILNGQVRNKIHDGKRLTEEGPNYFAIQQMRGSNGAAAGVALFDFATRNLCFCNEINENNGRWQQGPQFPAMGKIIAMERNPFTLEQWLVTDHSIEICDLRRPELEHRVILLPDEMKRPMLQMAPMGGRLVSFDGGKAIVWKIVGQPVVRAYHLQTEINRLLDKKDIATLDLLAEKLNGKNDLYSGAIFETPYVNLFRRFLSYPNDKTLNDERIRIFEDLQKANPDSKMLRLACYYLYSLPGSYSDAHAPAHKMQQGWEYVKPLFAQPKPPAEAYVALFAAGPILDLPLGGFLGKAYQDWPKYHRIYAEAALALSPIHDGPPEAAAAFAAKAANAIGGEEGDVMYVQIARYVLHYNGGVEKSLGKLKFDRERMKRGFLVLANRYDHTVLLNEALRFAGITKDKDMADQLVKRFGDLACFPAQHVAPNVYPTVDTALAPLAKRFNGE